jgi:transaldolase
MLFLDSSDPAIVLDLMRWGVVAGITTHPIVLAREAAGADFAHRIVEVLRVSRGPVHVALTSETEPEMLAEAQIYRAFDAPDSLEPRPSPAPGGAPAASGGRAQAYNRVVIKVPFSELGLRVTHSLAGLRVPTNVTCMTSFHQAYLAALAGATYVSIFAGRIRDAGHDPSAVISDTRAQLDREGLSTRLIADSVRHIGDVSEALSAGAHIVAVPPQILRDMLLAR